uniref:Uncharacterized protein n=1 Tax=Arundo donax TaxID=35708 RepID=A0A0A8XQT6_ARUDO
MTVEGGGPNCGCPLYQCCGIVQGDSDNLLV